MVRGILYFFGNLFRLILLFILIGVIYTNKNTKISADGLIMWVFFLFGGYSYIIGSFNLGEYKITLIGEGFSFGLAFAMYALTYGIINYILAHATFFCILILLVLLINRVIEYIRFKDSILMFFNVTSLIYIGIILISLILCLCSKISGALVLCMILSPLELINFTARAFRAEDVLDY